MTLEDAKIAVIAARKNMQRVHEDYQAAFQTFCQANEGVLFEKSIAAETLHDAEETLRTLAL